MAFIQSQSQVVKVSDTEIEVKGRDVNIAVVGAHGLVGQRMLEILSDYPVKLFAIGDRSAGKELVGKWGKCHIWHYQEFDFSQVEGCVISAGENCAKWIRAHAPHAWIVDNSQAFRRDGDCALVIPEMHQGQLPKVVASPNCIAIPVAMVLSVLRDLATIQSVWGSTYQSVSGAGGEALSQLEKGLGVADKVLAEIGVISDGISDEEEKVGYEVNRLLGMDIPVEMLCVRVPIRYGHSVHMRVTFENLVKASEAIDKLQQCHYIKYMDQTPTPKDALGSSQVFVGRVRQFGKSIDLWVVSDNLYRGAAWNVCEIAKRFFKQSVLTD